MNPFGVEHTPVAKRDYSRAVERNRKREKKANRVENAGQLVAGTAGAALGGAALRDAAFNDHPTWKAKATAHATRMPPAMGETLLHGKAGFKTLAAAAGGTVVAAAGTRAKNTARRRADRLEMLSKSGEPGSLMHASDVEIAKSMVTSDSTLRAHKKSQAALGGTAAAMGLGALTTKAGSKLLPKTLKIGKTPRGEAWAKHLDKTAEQLVYGASGVGGASGLHQASIYRAESKRPVKKAYSPEGRRKKRLVAYEAASGTATAGLAGGAAAHEVVRRKKATKLSRVSSMAAENHAQANRMDNQAKEFEALGTKHYRAKGRQFRAKATEAKAEGVRLGEVAGKIKVPSAKTSGKLAAGAVAAGAATAGLHRFRHGSGATHTGWKMPAQKPHGRAIGASHPRSEDDLRQSDLDRLLQPKKK